MPRTRQKTPRVGKPFPKQRTRAAKPKPEAKTVEQLQAEIIALVDTAEQLMMKTPRPPFRMSSAWDYPALDNAMKEHKKLCLELEQLLDGEKRYDYTKSDEPSKLDAWLDATFTDPAGTVPRWTRRGRFILWLDYLPMCICWTGIFNPDLTAVAVDPACHFIRNPQTTGRPSDVEKQRSLMSGGYLGLGSWQPVAPKWQSVLDMARHNIADIGGNMLLRPMTEAAKQNVRDTLIAEPWIGEALRRGPEHKLPMPRHLGAIQQQLFG